MKQVRARIQEIQGLRGIAILLVVAFHFSVRWTPPLSPTNYYPFHGLFVGTPLHVGWIGVELFFMISGFVIAITLESSKSLTNFFISRFSRIFPALALLEVSTWLIVNKAGSGPLYPISAEALVPSLTLIDPRVLHSLGLIPPEVGWVTGVLWSLWIEIIFYLVAGVIYFQCSKWDLSVVLFLLTLAGFLVTILRALDIFVAPEMVGAFLDLGIYLSWFTIGAISAKARQVGWNRARTNQLWVLFTISSATLVGIARDNFMPVFQVMLAIPLNLLFILVFKRLGQQGGSIPLLRSTWLTAIGGFSYELYLLHEAIGVSLSSAITDYEIGRGLQVAAFILVIACLVTISYLVEIHYSRRANSLLRKSLQARLL